jgi:hypothetical protein
MGSKSGSETRPMMGASMGVLIVLSSDGYGRVKGTHLGA